MSAPYPDAPPPRQQTPHRHRRLATHPGTTGHPAYPPLELLTRCIATGCLPGGTVLDPFSGTATTALHRLGLTPPNDDHQQARGAA